MKKLLFLLFLLLCFPFTYSQQWEWARKGDGIYYDRIGVCTDGNGNVYATGGFWSNQIAFGNSTLINHGQGDVYLVKYDKNGNVVWAKSGGGGFEDIAHGVTTDAVGNIYITGYFHGGSIVFGTDTLTTHPQSLINTFLVKYDQNGNLIWGRCASKNGWNQPYGISTDANANVYIAGQCTGPIAFDTVNLNLLQGDAFFLVKYDSSGNALWARGAGGGHGDCAYSVATDKNGNVFIAGVFRDTITIGNFTFQSSPFNFGEIFIAKYDSEGNVRWAKWISGINQDYGMGIATDFKGDVFVTGAFYSPVISFGNTILTNTISGETDIFLAKLDFNGNALWAKSFGGNESETGIAVTTDSSGNVYMIGDFNSPSVGIGSFILDNAGGTNCYWCNDIFIAKFDRNGNVIWAKSAGGQNEDTGYGVCSDLHSVYIAGYSGSPSIAFGNDTLVSNNSKVCIAKLSDHSGNEVAIVEKSKLNNSVNIYPNPSIGKFTIESSEKISSLEIKNILGEKVYSAQINSEKTQINLGAQPKGIYFIDAICGSERRTRKIILE